MTIILTLKKFISMFLTIFMIALSICPSNAPHDAKDTENVKLSFSVLSDCHIEGNNLKTYQVFAKILTDAKKNESGNDAIVFLGDNTMNGQDIESMFFYGAIDAIKPAKEVLVATGNHDLSNGEGEYNTFADRFMDYNNMFFGSELEKPYYYKVIEGCYFIMLSTEDATVDTMYISDEQLQWLGKVLAQAEQTNSPVFVMNHYPVDYIEGRAFYDLADVLNDYDNLLYFCGHTHNEYSEESVYEVYGIDCINLPKCTEHVYEDYDTGIGAQVEVYDGEIVVRIRDFYDGIWLEEYSY